jgi:hypothetical protein
MKPDTATTPRPGTSGLCRSGLVLVECLDYCKTLHSQALRNAQVLEVAGMVSCRVRDRERKPKRNQPGSWLKPGSRSSWLNRPPQGLALGKNLS